MSDFLAGWLRSEAFLGFEGGRSCNERQKGPEEGCSFDGVKERTKSATEKAPERSPMETKGDRKEN
jgi:hypothetical protein